MCPEIALMPSPETPQIEYLFCGRDLCFLLVWYKLKETRVNLIKKK